MAAGAVSQRKSHYIVILSFCNIVKGQANCLQGPHDSAMINFFILFSRFRIFANCGLVFIFYYPIFYLHRLTDFYILAIFHS